MGCPLQPDLVNTSCSESCAPDAVRACGRAVHLTHELARSRSDLHRPAHPERSPSVDQSREQPASSTTTQGTRSSLLVFLTLSRVAFRPFLDAAGGNDSQQEPVVFPSPYALHDISTSCPPSARGESVGSKPFGCHLQPLGGYWVARTGTRTSVSPIRIQML